MGVEEVEQIRNEADILVHVERTLERERLNYRLSFSTKLVDYFYNARAILAIGGETSAMEYLRENDGAIVETNPNNFRTLIDGLVHDRDMIQEYALKAWNCGKRNHRIQNIQKRIYQDFCNLIEKNKI